MKIEKYANIKNINYTNFYQRYKIIFHNYLIKYFNIYNIFFIKILLKY